MKKLSIIVLFILFAINLSASILLDFNHLNARLYGSAEAFIAEKNDLNNLEIFPASIARIENLEVSTAYLNWLEYINILKLSIGKRIAESHTLAASINTANTKAINNYDGEGTIVGKIEDREFGGNLGYGYLLKNNIQLGANLKYYNVKVNDISSDWFGLGFSGLVSITVPGLSQVNDDNLDLGLGIQNINIKKTKFNKEESGYSEHINFGLSYNFLNLKNLAFRLGSSIDYVMLYQELYNSAGLEIGWRDLIFFRSGYYIQGRAFDKLNLGLGVKSKLPWSDNMLIKFDYSNSLLSDIAVSHYLQLSICF